MIEVVECESFYGFVDEMQKRTRALEIVGAWYEVHFDTKSPFVRSGLTGAVEEEGGVYKLVTIPARYMYPDGMRSEDAAFFTMLRKFYFNGVLGDVMTYFFERLHGSFDALGQMLQHERTELEGKLIDAADTGANIRFSHTDGFELKHDQIAQVVRDMERSLKRLLWCRFFELMKGYSENARNELQN